MKSVLGECWTGQAYACIVSHCHRFPQIVCFFDFKLEGAPLQIDLCEHSSLCHHESSAFGGQVHANAFTEGSAHEQKFRLHEVCCGISDNSLIAALEDI